jgi:hypothetical protein
MSNHCFDAQDANVRGEYLSYSRCPNFLFLSHVSSQFYLGSYGVRLRMRFSPDPPCFHVPVISELPLFMVPS